MTQVWDATHINSHLAGGGTTIVTQADTNVYSQAFGSEGFSTGRYHFEFTATAIGSSANSAGGVGNTSSSVASGQWIGSLADSLGLYSFGGSINLYANNTQQWVANIGAAETDRFAIEIDIDAGLLWCMDVTIGSGWFGSGNTANGNPATGANGYNIGAVGTILAHPVVPGITLYKNGDIGTGYFAQSSWIGTASAGFGPFDPNFSTIWLYPIA